MKAEATRRIAACSLWVGASPASCALARTAAAEAAADRTPPRNARREINIILTSPPSGVRGEAARHPSTQRKISNGIRENTGRSSDGQRRREAALLSRSPDGLD